jgi:hypothetical protein
MFPLLGVLFLVHLLELVRFLAQLREGLLYGIVFLSAFLSGAEIGFFRSVFLDTTAIARIVRCNAPPCFLQRSQCFLVWAFFGTLGLWSVPGHYVPFLSLCKGFSLQEATDFLDLSWPHFLLGEGFLLRKALDSSDVSWPHRRSVASRDRRSRRMSTGVPPFSWRLNWSCHMYGHVCDLLDQPPRRGLEREQSSFGHTLNSPFHYGLASLSLVGFGFLVKWTNSY